MAAPPAQPYVYGSPPGVVNGLFKANLSDPTTAYVSFQTVVEGLTVDGFNTSLQDYYVNSIASFANESVHEVVILRVDSGPQSIAEGPVPANTAIIKPIAAASPTVAPINGQAMSGGTQPQLASSPTATPNRRLLQNSDDAVSVFSVGTAAQGEAIYIYTAVTLGGATSNSLGDTSLSAFAKALKNNSTAAKVVDPEGRAPGPIKVQSVIVGEIF